MKKPSLLAASLLPMVLLAAGCGGTSTGAPPLPPTPTTAPAAPPNIVLILTDDMGWGDLSAYGSTTIQTPTLDRLAREGVRFTSFYANPVCAPSRAALLTGRWPVRVGIPWNPPIRLNAGELTIADVLRARGYATGMVGKWHLGWEPADFPTHHGFDTYYGLPAGEDPSDFVRGDQITADPADRVRLEEVTERYTQEAVSWIQAHKDERFFFYLAHRSPHLPLTGSYEDVVREVDTSVGRIVEALRAAAIDRNTLVVFTSDNGPPPSVGSTGPFSGRKLSFGEGSVRVPAIAWWPARIPGGRVLDQPVANLDIFPTLVSLAGGTPPGDHTYDGVDITALLTGAATSLSGPGVDGGRELLYWQSERAVAIRSGKWKFVRQYSNGSTPALYDLSTDPGEQQNLWIQRPDLENLWKSLDARIDQLSAL